MAKAKKLVDSDLTALSVGDFNQFVRGRLYVLLDFLLTTYMFSRTKLRPEAEVILELFAATCSLACKWLSLCPKLLSFVSFY